MAKKTESAERMEALWRIPVLIVSGVILWILNYVMQLLIIVHWIYTLVTGKRIKDLAEFNNKWATFTYRFYRYMGFSTNLRSWPFNDFGKVMEPVDMKLAKNKKL